ncbi:hypothetical protein [Spartinivicinus poritis]
MVKGTPLPDNDQLDRVIDSTVKMFLSYYAPTD